VPLAPKAPGARSAPDEFLSIYSPFNLISTPLVRVFGPAWRAFPIPNTLLGEALSLDNPEHPSGGGSESYFNNKNCSSLSPGRSQPCYSSQSPFVGRSVGGPRHAPTAGKRPVPTRSGTRVAVFPSVRGGARRDARERPPTALSAWFPRVTTRPPPN